MRLETSGLALFTLFFTACNCTAPNASPDVQGESSPDVGSDVLDAVPLDSASTTFDSNALPDVPDDVSEDVSEPPPDAARLVARRLWLNPSPPTCARRDAPPRWRVTGDPGPIGSIRWVRSQNEETFRSWRSLGIGVGAIRFGHRSIAPALTGDGVVVWDFINESEETYYFGLQWDGGFGMGTQSYGVRVPQMWMPTEDMLVRGVGYNGIGLYAPVPPSFFQDPPTGPRNFRLLPETFGPGGPSVGTSGETVMPAWSPVTGDFVTFGSGLDTRGAGAGCAEDNRWFTQLPLHPNGSSAWVRPDGDAIVGTFGELWVLDGDNGEVLRSAVVIEEPHYGKPAAYFPGCGVLVELQTATSWTWVNDDTMARGPLLRLPVDRPTSPKAWSGTPDCGLVASAGTGNIVRLNADGTVRYNTPIPAGVGITIASPPVALADGGTLVMLDPPGWLRLNAAGEITSTVSLDTSRVGLRSAAPAVLAPDGTMYFMTVSGSEYRFGAASTGAIPGPYLWPNSGLNWARTNSILPD